jgi:hypothetical protein
VYMACKVPTTGAMRDFGAFREVGRANGFVFYRRDP